MVLILKYLLVFAFCFVLGCLSAFFDVYLKKRQLKKYGLTPFGNVYLDRLQVVSSRVSLGEKITKDDLRFLQAFQYYIESGGFNGK